MHEEIWSKTIQQEEQALREHVPGKVAGPQVVSLRRGPVTGAKAKDLKRVRKALGKSQSELAALLGISTRAVQSYEQGWRRLPPYVQRLTGLLLFLKRRKDGPNLSPCWEILECDGDVRSRCLAYEYRAGDFCWLVTGNCVAGREQDSWEAKLARCRECPVMKRRVRS